MYPLIIMIHKDNHLLTQVPASSSCICASTLLGSATTGAHWPAPLAGATSSATKSSSAPCWPRRARRADNGGSLLGNRKTWQKWRVFPMENGWKWKINLDFLVENGDLGGFGQKDDGFRWNNWDCKAQQIRIFTENYVCFEDDWTRKNLDWTWLQ